MGISSSWAHVCGMAAARKTPTDMPLIDVGRVAARVEALRMHLGLNKGDFALSFGLDPSSYSKVLGEAKPLKLDYGYRISERWGVTMDFIYRGDLSKMDEAMRASIMAHLMNLER